MSDEPARDLLDQIDKECEVAGVPPLSRLVRDVPGRRNATDEEVEEVFAAAANGAYDQMKIDALMRLFPLH